MTSPQKLEQTTNKTKKSWLALLLKLYLLVEQSKKKVEIYGHSLSLLVGTHDTNAVTCLRGLDIKPSQGIGLLGRDGGMAIKAGGPVWEARG